MLNFILGWLEDNSNGLIVGIISSIVVTLICYGATKIISRIKTGKSRFSGEWQQLIFSDGDDFYEGEAIKSDTYFVKHEQMRYSGKLTVNFTGTITRDFPVPKDDKYRRKWDFIGYLDGDILTILYQSQVGQKSRGCIYVKLFRDYEFRGYYLEEHKDGTIDKTPVIIKKKGV